MSIITYYNDALEEILDKVKNYTDDDEMPLLEELKTFARKLTIDIQNDINHIEYIRDLEESGKRYDCYNI